MKTWALNELDTQPRNPEIVESNDDARAIVIDLPAGESLDDHEVHERAWLVVVAGEIEVTALESGERASGGVGTLVEFEPTERHRVDARSDSRFLLLLTPWPGDGHPGALTLEEKARVRERAAERERQSPS
jgi:quercetin dioxygenase-like cupin family protein